MGIILIIYLYTLITFCINPDPYDYFRYAFQRKLPGLWQYYFMPIILISTICLFVFFSQIAIWSVMVPFGVLLVYVIIYRPFR